MLHAYFCKSLLISPGHINCKCACRHSSKSTLSALQPLDLDVGFIVACFIFKRNFLLCMVQFIIHIYSFSCRDTQNCPCCSSYGRTGNRMNAVCVWRGYLAICVMGLCLCMCAGGGERKDIGVLLNHSPCLIPQ